MAVERVQGVSSPAYCTDNSGPAGDASPLVGATSRNRELWTTEG